MRTILQAVAALAAALTFGMAVAAPAACQKTSPKHTVALLELYTSEGCDSCPPADAFVRGLYHGGLTADQVIPLALHVDYWDYIGWKDRFASARYTERQYWLADVARTRRVYTPEIFVGGREQPDWRDNQVAETVATLNRRDAAATLTLRQLEAPEGRFAAEVVAQSSAPAEPGTLQLVAALYENDLVSEVTSGENRGATLHHSYVVRRFSHPVALDGSGRATLEWQEALPRDSVRAKLGLVAFLQNTATGSVLQAVALPNCTTPPQ